MSEPVLKRTPGIRRALRALAASKRRNANRAASGKPVMIGGEKMTAGAYRQKYGLPDRLKKDYEMDDETIDATDEMVEDLVKQALWQARLRVEKGEGPGHPFRGNQHVRGKSGGKGSDGMRSRYLDRRTSADGPEAKSGMSLNELRGTKNPHPKGLSLSAGYKQAEFRSRWELANISHDSMMGQRIMRGETPAHWKGLARKGDSISSFRRKLIEESKSDPRFNDFFR